MADENKDIWPQRSRSRGELPKAGYLRTLIMMMLSAIMAIQLVPRECGLSAFSFRRAETDSLLHQDEQLETTTKTAGGETAKTAGDGVKDFQLAFDQSYGFFDDISEAVWKLYQDRARNHQDHQNPNKPNGFWPRAGYIPAKFYMEHYDPFFTCPHIRRMGGAGDGPKWTCDPHRLKRIANQRRIQAARQSKEGAASNPQTKCLIYSVGCAGKYQWEEALSKSLLQGDSAHQRDCEIHVFDFSGNFTKEGHADKLNIHFHQWGMKSSYDDSLTTGQGGKIMGISKKTLDVSFTLEEIVDKLGHTGHVIDILKVDCEFCEWFTYKDWLTNKLDIRQLLLETHNLPQPAENPHLNKGGLWFPAPSKLAPSQFFDDIEQAGFAMFSKEANIHPNAQGNGIEFAYIKLHPDFFASGPYLA